MNTQRTMRALALLVGGVLMAGCAGIPSAGPVERVADDGGPGQSTVRYAPVGPPRGASPQQILRGYLDAMLAYPVSTGVAALYLTPDAARSWRSSEGVTVYTSPQVTLSESVLLDATDESVVVDLRTRQVARLDRQGHYLEGTASEPRSYELRKVKGQWRISDPQDGVMVTRTYYDDYFRPFPLYFFDASGERLVPDLVHLAVGDQLPTGLVTALARGPANTPGAFRSYVPGAGSLRPSVTAGDDGVADVEFSASFAKLSDQQRDRLSAQIVWTLRSVLGLRGVRIFGGTPVLSARGERVHPIDSWGAYGPRSGDNHTYALVDDKLVEIDGDIVQPVTGAWGRDAGGAVEASVSDDAVAALLPGADQVRITDRDGKNPRDVTGAGFAPPKWDRDDHLWLVDRPAGSTRVRIVDDGRTRTMSARGLRRLTVESFALSPDGGRYALATGGKDPSLLVGPVRRDKDDRLTGLGDPRRLTIGVGDPHSVDWSSTTRLGFLGGSDAGIQLYNVALDGTDVTGGDTGGGPLLPDVDATTLAGRAGEDSARWVLDGRRRLWYFAPESSWRLIDDRRFTGLSTGD
ncbi:LpqB family beta-propeller domain-containing protein [Aeromicrobium sp.]|uniref:LpqB family beta-propeller domain-containing protein n=1 Tax=Aeromicrobium sp. TaxID=1871063 RepID=UPI003C5E0B21